MSNFEQSHDAELPDLDFEALGKEMLQSHFELSRPIVQGELDETGRFPQPTRVLLLRTTNIAKKLSPSRILPHIQTGKVFAFETNGEDGSVKITFVHKLAAESLFRAGPMFLSDSEGGSEVILIERLPNVDIPIIPRQATRILNVKVRLSPSDRIEQHSNLPNGTYLMIVDGETPSNIHPAFDNPIFADPDDICLTERFSKLVKIWRVFQRGEHEVRVQLQYLNLMDALEDWQTWQVAGLGGYPVSAFAIDPCAGEKTPGDRGNWETESEPDRGEWTGLPGFDLEGR